MRRKKIDLRISLEMKKQSRGREEKKVLLLKIFIEVFFKPQYLHEKIVWISLKKRI
jgi:hypothetical protein